MDEKMKLSLEDLEVQSFVTALEESDLGRLKGGCDTATDCPSDADNSCTSCPAPCTFQCDDTLNQDL